LPPIEDLHITVDESVQFVEIGKVASVVEVLGKEKFHKIGTPLIFLL